MDWMLLGIVLACAGFVQGYAGFGFGLVSMSLMPMFLTVKQAAVISTAFTLFSTVVTFTRHYRDYNWRRGGVFLASVCIGLSFGVLLLARSSEALLVRMLGGLMVVYAGREFLLPRSKDKFPEHWTVPLGLFSGAMSGAFNLGGVPGAAYAYAQPWSRGQIMGFLQVMITIGCVLRLVFYGNAGLFSGISWSRAAWLAFPLFIALRLGHFASERTHPRRFRQGIFVFIGVSGLYYLFIR